MEGAGGWGGMCVTYFGYLTPLGAQAEPLGHLAVLVQRCEVRLVLILQGRVVGEGKLDRPGYRACTTQPSVKQPSHDEANH
jgi:hypothetical protein